MRGALLPLRMGPELQPGRPQALWDPCIWACCVRISQKVQRVSSWETEEKNQSLSDVINGFVTKSGPNDAAGARAVPSSSRHLSSTQIARLACEIHGWFCLGFVPEFSYSIFISK